MVTTSSRAELLLPFSGPRKARGQVQVLSTSTHHCLFLDLWDQCGVDFCYRLQSVSLMRHGETDYKLKETFVMIFSFFPSLAQGMRLKKSTRALPTIGTATTFCSMTARMPVQNKGTRVLSPLSHPAWTQLRLRLCLCPQPAFTCGVNVSALSPDLMWVCSPASPMFW